VPQDDHDPTTGVPDLRAGWFAMRRTLAPHAFRQNLDELVAAAKPVGIDEVIVIVDPEELNHGHTPVDWIDRQLPLLHELRDELHAVGIAYSVNPWTTLSHGDRGRPPLPGIRTMVGHNGSRSIQSPCPLDEPWRAYMREAWTRFASTRPRVLWVEDDIRFSNHHPVHFGCFCEEHLRRFSEAIGQPVSRKELVGALLQPGEPHPWRALWLGMQRDIGTELAGVLGTLVRDVSPDTLLGLMSSGARTHAADNRDWKSVAEALGSGRPIVSRPTMGCYDEAWAKPRDLIFSKDSILLTRHVLPPGIPDLTEVEGVHFSPYAQSRRMLGLKIGISFACGARGATLNSFDHLGNPMADDPGVLETFTTLKPIARSLGSSSAGTFAGVRLFFADDAAEERHLRPGDDYHALTHHGVEAVEMFETHGIATTYDPSPVAALTGQSARSVSDGDITSLLGAGLFLDGEAAAILADRGFSPDLGLASIAAAITINDPRVSPCGAERWEGGNGEPGGLLSTLLPNFSHNARIHPIVPAAGARTTAELLDNDLRPRLPAMTAFENKHGGRVVCHAWEFASAWGDGFKGTLRARQLQWAVRWLARDAPPLITSGGPLALGLLRRTPELHLLSAFNLSYDPWPMVRWEFACDTWPGEIRRLANNGTWQPADDLQLHLDGHLAVLTSPHPLAFGDGIHLSFNPQAS
jgi:hypothetical protein